MVKINERSEIPAGVPPVQHNSGGIRTTPAGGEVSRDQYRQPVTPPSPAPTLEPRR
jgi:hypothetical protein